MAVEAALLGLLIASSASGALIALAAITALAAIAPLGILFAYRTGDTDHTTIRGAVIAGTLECAVVAGAIAVALLRSGGEWVLPYAWIAPLLLLETFTRARSTSDELTSQLSRAVIASVAVASIIIAGGGSTSLAIAAFLLLAAHATTSTSTQYLMSSRTDSRSGNTTTVCDVGHAAGVGIALVSCLIDPRMLIGFGSLMLVVVVQFAWSHGPSLPPVVINRWEAAFGVLIVVCGAGGVALA